MRRNKLLVVLASLVTVATTGHAGDTYVHRGTTEFDIPRPVFTAHLTETGGVATGATARIGIQHFESGMFCSKVFNVWTDASPDGQQLFVLKSYYPGGSPQSGGLCNMNWNDASFDAPFLFVTNQLASRTTFEGFVRRACDGRDRRQAVTVEVPFAVLRTTLLYNDGAKEVFNKQTTLSVTCDAIPCPPLVLGSYAGTANTALPDAQLGQYYAKQLFSGGRLPLRFTSGPLGLPSTLKLDTSGGLAGTPLTRGVYTIAWEIADACPYDNVPKRGSATLRVRDLIAPAMIAFKVEPTSFDYQGGTVKVTATATDNDAVFGVALQLTRPDGVTSAMRLPMISGTPKRGDWSTSFVLPMNTSGTPAIYHFAALANDEDGNTARMTGPDVTVKNKPSAPPLPTRPPTQLPKPIL